MLPYKFHDPEKIPKTFRDPEIWLIKFHDPELPLRPGLTSFYVPSLTTSCDSRVILLIKQGRQPKY